MASTTLARPKHVFIRIRHPQRKVNSLKPLLRIGGLAAVAGSLSLLGSAHFVDASSHREAPHIGSDPQADATDLYAFRSPERPDTITFVANYIPLQVPAAGPNFYRFGDDVLYEINIDNNGDAVEDVTYQFRFHSQLNPANAFGDATFLYNTGPVTSLDDPDLNQRQFYSVSAFWGEGKNNRKSQLIAENIPVAPANVGPTSFPDYESVAMQAVTDIGDGIKVFAGPRDDPFFVDLGGIFDLLSITGEDYVKGLNVGSIVIQVPISQLTRDGMTPGGTDDPDAIIGVRTTSYRQSTRVLRNIGVPGETGSPASNSGSWVQLSRLDLPLVNEAVITLKDKDRFNASRPKHDGQFLSYVQNSHLAALLNLVLGVQVPESPRNDLVDALLLGLPGLNRPAGVVPSSQLRLNMAVPVSMAPSSLGVLRGDLQGFPNGRRLADDVTDIELRVIAGALVAETGEAPGDDDIGDGVNANDKPFGATFPYLASPHSYAD